MPDLSLSLSIGGAKTALQGSPGTLTIGNDGTNFGFSQGAYGAVTPTSIGGLAVNAMAVDQSDLFVIQFAGNAQISGVSSIGIIFPGYVPTLYAINWNGANTRYQATFAGLTTYFTAQDGNAVPFLYRL